MPIDDEMTCHRKSRAIEATIMSTAIMAVMGERFIVQVYARIGRMSSPCPVSIKLNNSKTPRDIGES